MFKEDMTDEQKYWYLFGYIDSLIQNISIDMKIPEKEVRKWLVEKLEGTLHNSKKQVS